jgi:hypothetical protein
MCKTIAAYCVATEDVELFHTLLVNCKNEERAMVERQLRQLHASKFLRLLARSNLQSSSVSPQELGWREEDETVWLSELCIGTLKRLFKKTKPYEAQSRIAYDVFYENLYDFLAENYQIIVLHDNESDVELFAPSSRSFDWESIWSATVNKMFSLEKLRKSFIALVNSIKLTNRGFSALDVPVVHRDQAQVLAAFDLANLLSLQNGDKRREREIAEVNKELHTTSDPKKIDQLHRHRQKLEAELETRSIRYGGLYEEWAELVAEMPQWAASVERLAKVEFSPTAGTQIAKVGTKIGKAVQQIKSLAIQTKFYQVPPLLNLVNIAAFVRPGGDSSTKICYGCGVAIPKGAPAFQANSFIFSSPSQRLQSGGSQTQPNVCGVCAALAFISPIKLGEGRLVVRLHQRGQNREYMQADQLRMLALGDFNVVAGRYALLQANEMIGNKPIVEQLGGVQYAIYKIATLFLPEVFVTYEPEVVIGEATVQLESRHVAWMHRLNQVFNFQRRWEDKGQFAAFGRAIRYIQKDKVLFAIYDLLNAALHNAVNLDRVRANQLEVLRSEHVRWLEMDNQEKKAVFYRDVAGMTGLLYAFCRYVYGQTSGNERRIEVRKLIERITDPNQFIYTAAANTKSERATLYRSEDMHFSYEETKRLLTSIGVPPGERESLDNKGQLQLVLYFDDVIKAYFQLFETEYRTTKEQRDFVYALKLSLHARFPDLIDRQKESE